MGKPEKENLWRFSQSVSDVRTCNKLFGSFTAESMHQTLHITITNEILIYVWGLWDNNKKNLSIIVSRIHWKDLFNFQEVCFKLTQVPSFFPQVSWTCREERTRVSLTVAQITGCNNTKHRYYLNNEIYPSADSVSSN